MCLGKSDFDDSYVIVKNTTDYPYLRFREDTIGIEKSRLHSRDMTEGRAFYVGPSVEYSNNNDFNSPIVTSVATG